MTVGKKWCVLFVRSARLLFVGGLLRIVAGGIWDAVGNETQTAEVHLKRRYSYIERKMALLRID